MAEFNIKTLKLEGQLSKFTNIVSGYKFRYFVVNTTLARLDYFMSDDMKHQKPRGSIELENAVISPSEEDSTTFLIHTIDNELFKLRAMDAKERQHWVNVLRFVSQSFNPNSSGQTGNGSMRKSQSQIIQNEKCTYELVKQVLNQVKISQQNLDQLISKFPFKSELLGKHDKDILVLKATARACTNCVSECCNIIKSIQNKKLISSKMNAMATKSTFKRQMHHEKKTDLKQNINIYNGAKSDYVQTILPKSGTQSLSISISQDKERRKSSERTDQTIKLDSQLSHSDDEKNKQTQVSTQISASKSDITELELNT